MAKSRKKIAQEADNGGGAGENISNRFEKLETEVQQLRGILRRSEERSLEDLPENLDLLVGQAGSQSSRSL